MYFVCIRKTQKKIPGFPRFSLVSQLPETWNGKNFKRDYKFATISKPERWQFQERGHGFQVPKKGLVSGLPHSLRVEVRNLWELFTDVTWFEVNVRS